MKRIKAYLRIPQILFGLVLSQKIDTDFANTDEMKTLLKQYIS